jgi:hypothetical protein
MPTLLEISGDLLALSDLLEESGGEVTPETEAAIDAWFADLGEQRDAKIDNYAALVRELTLRAAARKEEQERLALCVRVDENTVKRLKERLKLFMELQGLRKLETARYRVSVQANGGRPPLEIPDATAVPVEYQRVVISADVDAIHAALKQGVEVPGVRQLARGSHLRIA